MYYLHKATSAVSCIKPNASQSEVTLRDDIGFPTVYHKIYRRKFLTLSNQTPCYLRKFIRIKDIQEALSVVVHFRSIISYNVLKFKALIALDGRLSLGISRENGPEWELTIIFNP